MVNGAPRGEMEYVSLSRLVAHFNFCQESDKKGTEQKAKATHF